MLHPFLFDFWKSMEPCKMNANEIPKRPARCHNTINLIPFQHFSKTFIYLFFHEGEAGCHFISVHVAIKKRGHHGPTYGILIKSSEQCVVIVRMVRFHALVQYFLNQLQEFWLGQRVFGNSEVDFSSQLFGLL